MVNSSCLNLGPFVRYLAEKYQNQGVPLLGKTLKERAIINQWCEVEGQTFHPEVTPIVQEGYFAGVEKRPVNEEFVTSCAPKVEAMLDVYDIHLSQNKYLAGDNFTLADALHLPYLNRLMAIRKEFFTERKHVLAWAESLISWPAFQKGLAVNSVWEKD